MRKSIATLLALLVVASLAIPAVATAAGGPPEGKGKSAAAAKGQSAQKGRRGEAAPLLDETGRPDKAAVKQQKAAVKQEKVQAKVERKAAKTPDPEESDATSPSVDGTPSVEGTKAVGPGVANALARITRNLERKIERRGWDAALPPGLMRVWLKFSNWLGMDTTVTPWTPPASGEDTTTPPPSDDGTTTPPPSDDGTTTPPPSDDDSSSVDPSATVVPDTP